MNPLDGKKSGDGTHYLDYISSLDGNTYRPAFHYRANGAYIKDCIQQHNLTGCMLVCQNNIDVSNVDFTELAESTAVTSFNVEDPGRNRSLSRYLKGLGKSFVRLDSPFQRQLKNSDYLVISEHQFSEEHLYFEEDGFFGFSDYTVLPSEYIEGGSTPRAVVIHLTYLNEQNQIWIRHFTSNTNDSITNVQGKFEEAAAKAVAFCRDNNLTNSAIEELIDHYDNQHYPGLGTIKKISIKNHIIIVADYLRNR
jgi:hypothetical protein